MLVPCLKSVGCRFVSLNAPGHSYDNCLTWSLSTFDGTFYTSYTSPSQPMRPMWFAIPQTQSFLIFQPSIIICRTFLTKSSPSRDWILIAPYLAAIIASRLLQHHLLYLNHSLLKHRRTNTKFRVWCMADTPHLVFSTSKYEKLALLRCVEDRKPMWPTNERRAVEGGICG